MLNLYCFWFSVIVLFQKHVSFVFTIGINDVISIDSITVMSYFDYAVTFCMNYGYLGKITTIFILYLHIVIIIILAYYKAHIQTYICLFLLLTSHVS